MGVQEYLLAKSRLDRGQWKVLRLTPSLSGVLKLGQLPPDETPKEVARREELEAAMADLKQAKAELDTIVASLSASERKILSLELEGK